MIISTIMYFIFMSLIFSIIPNNYVFCNGSEDGDLADSTRPDALNFLPELNPNETHDGRPIIEGDIAFPSKNETEDKRGHIEIWPDNYIFYTFHPSVDYALKTKIGDAWKEWEKHTCLKFLYTKPDYSPSSYILFRADKNSCYTDIGTSGSDPDKSQDVSLGCKKGQTYRRILLEIGHAIGYDSEQFWKDQDGDIHFNWDNVNATKKYNFDLNGDNPGGIEDDYTSMMDSGPMIDSTKHAGISFKDAKAVNMLYRCSDPCPNKKHGKKCKNGGYLSPYREDGSACACVCPPDTSGYDCRKVHQPLDLEYYAQLSCGGNITEETVIQTPGYPTRKLPPDSCFWWIQAPEGKCARIEFVDFNFHPRILFESESVNASCHKEKMELRIGDRHDGDIYCGEEIRSGTVITSPNQEIIIIVTIDADENTRFGKGMKAEVSFVDPDS